MEQERQDKLQALLSDQAFVSELLRKTKPEDAQAYFEENGLTLSHEEIMQLGEGLNQLFANNGELSDDELAQVAGGSHPINWLKAAIVGLASAVGVGGVCVLLALSTFVWAW